MAGEGMLKLVPVEKIRGRRGARHKVFLFAKIVTTSDEIPVKLRNLTAAGTMIEGAKLPVVDSGVIIRRGSLEMFGTVRWVKGRNAGIHFDPPLSEQELWTQLAGLPKQREEPKATAPYRRPGVTRSAALSAEEEEMARSWAQPEGRRAFLD